MSALHKMRINGKVHVLCMILNAYVAYYMRTQYKSIKKKNMDEIKKLKRIKNKM